MSQAMRKLAGLTARSRSILLFTNQIREKIGVMFGNPETTSGGRALKYYSSIRIDVRRIATIKEGDAAIGNRTRAKVVKNKVAPPFQHTEFDIIYGKGASREGSLLDIGVDKKVIERSGAWFTYGDTRLGQGRNNAKQFLLENKDVAAALESEIRRALGLLPPESEEASKDS
jgi:recombination protein RecA